MPGYSAVVASIIFYFPFYLTTVEYELGVPLVDSRETTQWVFADLFQIVVDPSEIITNAISTPLYATIFQTAC